MKKKLLGIAGAAILSTGIPCQGTELAWSFINPSFVGGMYYNASWLMAEAQAQNGFKAKTKLTVTDPVQDFQDNLNRQILYRLSQKIVDSAFGEEGLSSGHYDMEGYGIDISTGANGVDVKITNPITGEETIITIPHY